VFTAWDLADFAESVGHSGPPFRWVEERRALLRAELDAMMFRLYGVERDDVDYIMETFPILKRKDEAEFREYRTKRLILERYDAMAAAEAAGEEYAAGASVAVPSRVDPPGLGEVGKRHVRCLRNWVGRSRCRWRRPASGSPLHRAVCSGDSGPGHLRRRPLLHLLLEPFPVPAAA
jgi:hypothetical protein